MLLKVVILTSIVDIKVMRQAINHGLRNKLHNSDATVRRGSLGWLS